MLLAEIPKMLLLLLGQGAEQLALAAAAAFTHREKARLPKPRYPPGSWFLPPSGVGSPAALYGGSKLP